MNVVVGADRAGFAAKPTVQEMLQFAGHHVIDVGANSEEPVDFPEISRSLPHPGAPLGHGPFHARVG